MWLLHSCFEITNIILKLYPMYFSLNKWSDGAALIYTSVKEEKNLDLLYKYIVHKTYGFQFTTPALVVEKDAVFM